jgi:Sugar transferases involved in lipopolysaccharide synthesis
MFVEPESANKMFFTIFLLVVLFMLISQYILVHELRKSRSKYKQSRVLMVGTSENIQEYIYYLKKTSIKFNIIGYISTDSLYEIPELESLGDLKSLSGLLTRYKVDEVIFAVHYSKIKDIEPYIVYCENQGIIARIALDFLELNRVNSYIHCVGTIPVLSFQTITRKNYKKTIKRLFDVVIAFIGTVVLVILSIPLIPVILLGSGRPVFHKEDILTLNGYFFKQTRFRVDEQKAIGRFLKKTGLAGLPQTINVLKGDMSIVGTKPATPADVESFDKNDFRRLGIKPGVIGLWMLGGGKDTGSSNFINAADEKYIDTWGLTKDLGIILKTLVHKFARK